MNYVRKVFPCAMIRRDDKNPGLSVIAVGGQDVGILDTVEILDEGSNTWRLGPYLPIPTMAHSLVEDPRGGVIMIGGNTGLVISTSLYRLRHGGAKWELMTQQLKVGNSYPSAFLIPDSLALNCTLN
jgi:hypothetical protein